MSRNKVFSIFSFSTLIVVVLSALFTVPALADSGTTVPSGAPSTSTTQRNARHAPSSSNNLSQLPSGTKVVIVDDSGNNVPLGSQAAQDILTSGDPIWCPSTVKTPIAGLGGCSPAFFNTSLYTLTYVVTYGWWMPAVTNSTIWITSGADSSASDINLDGNALPLPIANLKNFTLTLNGGWTGVGATLNPAAPSTFNNVEIEVTHWNNNIALNNLVVNNSTFEGIRVATSKNIKLTNIQSHNAASNGVVLDTTSGTGGSVTVTNSSFTNASGTGLGIGASGAVTLTNITATNNFSGVFIQNDYQGMGHPQNVIMLGTNNVSSNAGDGLDVQTYGAITINNLTADGLGEGDGANLYYGSHDITGNVTLTGVNNFDFNINYGLNIVSKGTVVASNLNAFGNEFTGVSIVNTAGTGAVTLNGNNTFTRTTGGNGLYIASHSLITANNITASNNYYGGVNLITTAGVKLTGLNVFYNTTAGDGLDITSTGVVSVSNIIADTNYYDGLYVSSASKLTVTCGSFHNNGTVYGYGWETLSGVPSITVTGADYGGNFSGNFYTNGGPVPTQVTKVCTTVP